MTDLCFATNNKGKLAEIKSLLAGKYNVLSLQEIGCNEELPETSPTIPENSRQKAQYVFEKYKVNCFADDTGLEVEALNGEPGVYSARYAGPECNANNNMNLLLKNLKSQSNRSARFLSCITLVLNGEYHQFEGTVNGEIIDEKIGTKGFGYDPIFVPSGFNRTFAELEMDEKNKISHRGKAVRKLVAFLESKVS